MSEEKDQSDLGSTFLIPYLKECYHAQVLSLHHLPSASGKSIYQLKLADGKSCILRIVAGTDKATLAELTRLLLFFEQQNYPAERIILTIEQTAIITISDRHLLMTTFLSGIPLDYTPTAFAHLGAIIGKLHALKPELTYLPPHAGMLPSGELAFAQRQLTAVASMISHQHIVQYEFLLNALSSMDRGTNLPTTLIHNDCHPANALFTVHGHVTLLDWEGAGMGSAILDVAFLLANCDGKTPWESLSTTPFHPAKEYLQAVIKGYCQHHQLSTDELDYLLNAMRFRSLVFGTCNFVSAISQHADTAFSQWWWKRYCAAEEITDIARMYFEHRMSMF